MAGYIINLDSESAMTMYIQNGVYSTKLSPPKGRWQTHHEGTFADYATMKPGDHIYFFLQRRIYGIGILREVCCDCKFLNYPDASTPENFDYGQVKRSLLWDEGEESINQRWICLFKPHPYFFTNGIDMDDVLASNPHHFRMLRAFWKVSFIKVDDDEDQALMDVILRANQDVLAAPKPPKEKVYPSNYRKYHKQLAAGRIGPNYHLTSRDILRHCTNGARITHEMAIEAGLLYQLAIRETNTVGIFGEWDYLSHQVVASPFKPIDYMDKMDVFGYSYLPGFNRTKSRFLICEIKKDNATVRDVDQLMKYVDWVKDEYTYGDYSMLYAFLVAYDFPHDVVAHTQREGERKYTIGRRPASSATWSNIKLVRYRFNPANGFLQFSSSSDNEF
jgi:hypothetical protein